MNDRIACRSSLRITNRSGSDIDVASVVCHLAIVRVTGKERGDRPGLHYSPPFFHPGIHKKIFPDLKWVVMLEHDDTLVSRDSGVHFVAKPNDLFVLHAKRSAFICVQTNEAISTVGKS